MTDITKFRRRDDAVVPPAGAAPPENTTTTPEVDEESLKKRLRGYIERLLVINNPVEARKLTIEIQRTRVALHLLREVGGEAGDGKDIYKEMTLLNRMMAGVDDDSGENLDDAAAVAEAESILAKRGVDPMQAARLANVLTAIVSRTTRSDTDGSR